MENLDINNQEWSKSLWEEGRGAFLLKEREYGEDHYDLPRQTETGDEELELPFLSPK